jgi:hypothetical protein
MTTCAGTRTGRTIVVDRYATGRLVSGQEDLP